MASLQDEWASATPIPASQNEWDSASPVKKAPPTTLERLKQYALENPVTAVGDAAYNLASGAIAAPVSGLAGLVGAVLPGKPGQGAAWQEATADALTHHTATAGGKALVDTASYPFQKLAEAGDELGSITAEKTGSPAFGAAVNAGVNFAPQVLSHVAGRVAPGGINPRMQATRDTQELNRRPNDAAAENVRSEGYRVSPSSVDPSVTNKVVESAMGADQLAHDFSMHNQPIAQNAVRAELGIRQGVKLAPEEFAAERARRADPAYDAVRAEPAGPASRDYLYDLARRRQQYDRQSRAFPNSTPPEIADINELVSNRIDPEASISKIRELRNNARMLRAGDRPDVLAANLQSDLANIVERELEDHLRRIGAAPDVINNFREARQYTAISHTLQDHVNAAGEVDAKGIGKLLADANPPPMSPRVRAVADLGAHFPTNTRLPSEKPPTFGISDFALAGAGGFLGHLFGGTPGALAGSTLSAALRPMGRKMINNNAAQNMMASRKGNSPSALERALGVVQQPGVPLAAMSMGQDQYKQALLDALMSQNQ
jgi:hypothetical protein